MAYGVIYLIIDGTNDKEYVGQTTLSIKKRFKKHKQCKKSLIGKAIRAHGEEMFFIVVLKECESKEELNYWEKHFIKSRYTKVPNGYNLTDGGEGTPGLEFTPEHCAKLSIAAIERFKDPTERAKMVMINTGKSLTTETRAKLSVVNSGENNPFFGKHHTEESLAKMSEAHRGNTAWVGRHHRKESKIKLSIARRADSPFKNLLAEMDKRQMSYKDLAELLGLARTTLPEKIRGEKNFTKEQVAKLEEIFGLPAEYLLKRD